MEARQGREGEAFPALSLATSFKDEFSTLKFSVPSTPSGSQFSHTELSLLFVRVPFAVPGEEIVERQRQGLWIFPHSRFPRKDM